MNVELSVLKYLLNKEHYDKYSSHISQKDFPDELRIVYTSLCSLHSINDGSTNPGVMDLANMVFSLSPKDKEFYEKVFETLETYTPVEASVVKLIDSLKRRNVLQKVSLAAYEECEGKQPEGYTESIFAALQNVEHVNEEEQFVSDDLDIILNDTIKQPGLRWRLECLNKSLGSLRKGDFGFIFARPEAGKTTFLASEISYMLEQTSAPILWFNNEEQGSKVMLRVLPSDSFLLNTLYHY